MPDAPAPKETPKDKIPPPPGISVRGRRLWRAVADGWQLRADELRVLEDACREADLIDILTKASKGADLIVLGAARQPVINPLISELRQHRTALAGLLRQLKLPDSNDTAENRSNQARDAANARWHKRGA